jgi:2-amino-4-hydroxy-6-hydroxymethyldihydropteridine diphosphokinase
MRWYPAYVGIGSNLDDPPRQVKAALSALGAAPFVHSLRTSRCYGSRALGDVPQPDYCNAVCAFLATLAPEALLAELRALELRLGRAPARERWASRPIDLDLLCYGSETRDTPTLQLPHQGIAHRNFVLYPLAELAPDLVVPGVGRVSSLARAASSAGIWLMDHVE